METFLPDEAAVVEATIEDSKYMAFMTKTLEGELTNSTMFYEYDMTVVNFWASYCLNDGINELDTLQEYYEKLKKEHPNVNFIQIVIDTPDKTAEKLALDAYKEAGVTFTGIMPDEHLAKWIVNNLSGLPTTVFVDNKGMPRDYKVEGMQDASYYMEITENMLQVITK